MEANGVQRVAKVLVVSDSAWAGGRVDESGPRLTEVLRANDFDVVELRVVADGVSSVSGALEDLAAGFHGLVVSTGGTGFSPRDLTPEATRCVLERDAPGLAEAMRASSPFGRLGRGLAGTRGQCLIVNVPGSPRGAVESIEAIIDVIPHALSLLGGGDPH